MEEKDIAIQITGLKKRYRLGTIGGGTLRGDLQSWWARVRHKEDPNSKIGSKVYGKNETFMALDGIDLTVYKGERVGIIGHNGAGKSTLLKLLSRVTGPTEGEIKLDGRISSMLEVGTGFNGELTGRENVYLNGAILGMTKAEIDSKIDKIIEFSECAQFIDTPVKRYSSGMYVKLAFAVASHLDSEILIMDEVLAVGDVAFQKKCLEKMSQVSQDEGRTILYVSHNMNTIRQLCNRCIVMDHGKIVFNGDVSEGIDRYLGNKMVAQNAIVFHKDHKNKFIKNPDFIFESLEMKSRLNVPVYTCGEKMEMVVTYRCKKAIENMAFSMVFYFYDQSPVSMTTSERFNIEQTEQGKLVFSVDISHFAPGKYTMDLCSYEASDFADTKFHDMIVKNVINFEVTESPKFNFGRGWNHSLWGHIVSEKLEVGKMDEREDRSSAE